jgi:hypothetical protein
MDVNEIEAEGDTTSKGEGNGQELPTQRSEQRMTKVNSEPSKNNNSRIVSRTQRPKITTQSRVPKKTTNLRPRDGVISIMEGNVNNFISCFATIAQRLY